MKNHSSKTIQFKDKKDMQEHPKTKKQLYKKALSKSSKVIPYPSKKSKAKAKGVKVAKNNKTTIIILCLVGFFAVISLLDKQISKKKAAYSNPPKAETSTNTSLSSSEFESYSVIVTSTIKDTLDASYDCVVKTETMHKNGNSIYAQGHFSLPDKANVPFDMVLKNKKAISFVVNGAEYIKNN